jgi:ribosome-associated protein
VSTKAELTVDRDAVEGLPELVAARLVAELGLDDGPLRITAQEERALSQNRTLAAERLEQLVTAALAPPPPTRRPTRPSARAKTRRVAGKRQRGEVKRLRKPPGEGA